MKKLTGIIIGSLLIAAGILYLLSTFGISDVKISFDGWWTLFIIVPCLEGIFSNQNKTGNFIGLLAGVLLLLAAQDVFEYNMVIKILAPVIVILIGIKLIVRVVTPKKDKNTKKEQNENFAAFSSKNFDFAETEVTVAKIGAVFGGAECNLTDAKIQDQSEIEVFCAFGGADIIVPENVNIKINAFCLFGGIEDKRAVKNFDPNAKTLNINGFCLFGGADIK